MSFDFNRDWVEYIFLVLFVIGFLLPLMINNKIVSIIVIFLSGIFSGAILHRGKKHSRFVVYSIIAVGFLAGYVIGSFNHSRIATLLLFVIGNLVGFYLLKKEYIKFF